MFCDEAARLAIRLCVLAFALIAKVVTTIVCRVLPALGRLLVRGVKAMARWVRAGGLQGVLGAVEGLVARLRAHGGGSSAEAFSGANQQQANLMEVATKREEQA